MPLMTMISSVLSGAAGRLLVALMAAVPLWVMAAPIEAGSNAPAIALRDQHDKPVVVDRSTSFLVFAAERPVSDWVNKTFTAQGTGALVRVRAVYVADISGMPTLITNTFALPKWKQLPFPIGLARDATQVADIPRRPGQATVVALKDGVVAQLQFASDGAQLRQWLGLQPPQ